HRAAGRSQAPQGGFREAAGVGAHGGAEAVYLPGGGLYDDLRVRSSIVPYRLSASITRSVMSTTDGSCWLSTAMCWNRSCWGCPDWISAAMAAGTSAVLMWSMLTVTPTCSPHALAKGSNQES